MATKPKEPQQGGTTQQGPQQQGQQAGGSSQQAGTATPQAGQPIFRDWASI
jgi:hypothetical protein